MKNKRSETLAQWLDRFPAAKAIPFQVNRRRLYRIPELYKGYNPKAPETWASTFDRLVYQWTIDPYSKETRHLRPADAVAERLHDTAIGQAIGRFLDDAHEKSHRPVVGFMGGHGTSRKATEFRAVAEIARALRRLKFTIVSGGGPGLMEAANFGAFMAPYTDEQFETALLTLANSPDASKNAEWVQSACALRAQVLPKWNAPELADSASLGIPTWFYGNEPPNLFATHTGKYFFNSIREDGLVSVANGGIVFGPGAAGTVQEIFQDTTLNFYRKSETPPPSPMVLLGVDYWNPVPAKPSTTGEAPKNDPRKPVYPLLSTLANQADINFFAALLLTDDAKKIVDFIANFPKLLGVSDSTPKRSDRFKGRALAAL
jgi:predicted Rossmann-fold nucleotide-binding protein